MPGIVESGLLAQVAAVVIPAAVYFLLLGLLNSRPTPQLVSGRTDFVLLNAAFFPLVCIPVLNCLGTSVWIVVAVLGMLLAGAILLAPRRGGNWVIYNISLAEAVRAAERSLQQMDLSFARQGRRLVVQGRGLALNFTCVPLLRNVSVSAEGTGAEGFGADFQRRMGGQLARLEPPTSRLASAFLLISAGLLVTPLGLLANRMPEMVRLITDLVR